MSIMEGVLTRPYSAGKRYSLVAIIRQGKAKFLDAERNCSEKSCTFAARQR